MDKSKLAFVAVCLLVAGITASYFVHKGRIAPITDAEKEEALKIASAAVEGRLSSNYTTYTSSSGRKMYRDGIEKKVALVSFVSEERSILVLVDLNAMKPVRIIESFDLQSNASRQRWMRTN